MPLSGFRYLSVKSHLAPLVTTAAVFIRDICAYAISAEISCTGHKQSKPELSDSLSGGSRGGSLDPPLCPLFLNILWKWSNLVSVRPNYFIFMGYMYLRKMRRNQQCDPPPPPHTHTYTCVPLYTWTPFLEILDPPLSLLTYTKYGCRLTLDIWHFRHLAPRQRHWRICDKYRNLAHWPFMDLLCATN